jgi:DNA-binding HxlR family transcriptional regulator
MDRMDSFCPRYHFAVELIGRRWTGAILRALLAGKTTYAEIRLAVPRLSDTMLSERLHELQREGIVERTVIPDARRTVEYRLTDKGQALEAVVAELSRWAEEWLEDKDATSEPATATQPARAAARRRSPQRQARASRA